MIWGGSGIREQKGVFLWWSRGFLSIIGPLPRGSRIMKMKQREAQRGWWGQHVLQLVPQEPCGEPNLGVVTSIPLTSPPAIQVPPGLGAGAEAGWPADRTWVFIRAGSQSWRQGGWC